MTDLQLFIKSNDLKNLDVANYLGVSPQHISAVSRGKGKLAEKLIVKLIENDMGWDASCLTPKVMAINSNNINNGQTQNVGSLDDRVLTIHSDYLALLKKKDEQIDKLISIIAKD